MLNNFISTSTVQAIKDAMSPIGAAIGKGAEYGWTVLIKQQYVVGFGDLFLALGSLIVLVIAYRFAIFTFNKQIEIGKVDQYNDGGYGILCGLSVVAGAVAFCILLAALYGGVAHFINPDFYALQFLVDAVKPASN